MEVQILFEEHAALHRLCLNGPNVLEDWWQGKKVFTFVSFLYVLTVLKLWFGNRSSVKKASGLSLEANDGRWTLKYKYV